MKEKSAASGSSGKINNTKNERGSILTKKRLRLQDPFLGWQGFSNSDMGMYI